MNKFNRTLFKTASFVTLSVSLFAVFFLISGVQAQPLPQRGPIPFSVYDLDSNGGISQDEFNTIRGLRMQNRAAQGYPMRNMSSEPNFNRFDTDKDGQLNPDELARGQQLQWQKRQQMRQGQGMGMGMNKAPGQGMGMKGGRHMPEFADFDGNNDGYISEQELIEARSMRISNRIQQGYQMRNTGNIVQFQEIDTNSDGKISPKEFSTQQRQHQMMRQRPQ